MMIPSIAMILAVAVCFVAAVLNLAVDSGFRKKTTRAAIVLAMLIGAVFYGYGYAWCMGFSLISLIRALMALCRMFGGINDLASVQAAPIFQYPAAVTVFSAAHLRRQRPFRGLRPPHGQGEAPVRDVCGPGIQSRV